MLSTEPNLPLENDILPTQNIGLLENQNQPQVYSLLPNSNGPLTTKGPRRKRTTKIDETLPVTINPSITRISTGFTCPASHQYPTINHRIPCKVYLRSNSHDANNNIQQNSIGRYSIPLNSSLSSQMLSKTSSPIVNLTSQSFEVNHLLSNNPNERTTSIPVSCQNESMRYNTPLTTSHSILSAKPKRRYVKRRQTSVSAYPVALVQPSVSNGLPSIIPVTLSEEHSRSMCIPTANFLPPTPPSSIKSSPTNIISDSSIQTRSESTHYSSVQKLITDTNLRNFQPLLTVAHPPYCMVPAGFLSKGFLSMACPAITPLESNLIDAQMKKPSIMQSPFAQLKSNGEPLHSRLVAQNTSAMKKRKAKILSAKDIQTKMQLRRMIRRNRRAVFKFMMHKQKQQKQKIPAASTTTTETIVEQTPTDNASVTETIKPILPDIIASNLKIKFDARQKVESISLVYHRRRKPECKHENPWKVSSVDNNHLDLLIEAMELVETFRDQSKLPVPTET